MDEVPRVVLVSIEGVGVVCVVVLVGGGGRGLGSVAKVNSSKKVVRGCRS